MEFSDEPHLIYLNGVTSVTSLLSADILGINQEVQLRLV